MLHSAGSEYAIRALSKLAMEAEVGEFVLLRDIVDGIDVPAHFVSKIFQSLVRASILRSAKGRGGGYALARPAARINLREIVYAIDGSQRINRCVLGLSDCDDDQPCPQHDTWKPVRKQIDILLDKTTLDDLGKALARKLSAQKKTRKKKKKKARR